MFESGNFIAQRQAALFQPAQQEFVQLGRMAEAVDQHIEVGVFDACLDQATLGRVEVGIQEDDQM